MSRGLKLGLMAALLLGPALWAGEGKTTVFGAGRQAQPWLSLSTDARAAAMGEAVVASASDVQALNSNPAGLSLIYEPQLAFTHNEWNSALGMRQEYLAWGRRLGEGGFGLSLNYFSFGTFDNRDASGKILDSSSDVAYALNAGWGTGYLDDRLQLGFSVQASQQALGAWVSNAVMASAGGLYEIRRDLMLGARYGNVGLLVEGGGEAPSQLDLGVNWQVFNRKLAMDLQWSRPTLAETSTRLGMEWRLPGEFKLRAGWRMGGGDAAEADRGYSVGAGVKLGAFMIDYAFVPYGELTRAHRVGLSLDLSQGIFGGDIVIAGTGVTQNAQVEFDEGKAAYEQRDWYVAKVALNRALKAYPQFSKAGEIRVMLEDIERKIAADKSRGLTPEAKKNIERRIERAKKLMNNDDLGAARKELEAVLEFDANFKEALGMLKQINSRLGSRVAGLKQEAFKALSSGDIAEGVLKYRRVLRIDDNDAEASSALRKLAPRIRLEAKRLHREGIDLYVTSEIKKAIKLWEKALELDPGDPYSIRRDLEKARKLLELRGERADAKP